MAEKQTTVDDIPHMVEGATLHDELGLEDSKMVSAYKEKGGRDIYDALREPIGVTTKKLHDGKLTSFHMRMQMDYDDMIRAICFEKELRPAGRKSPLTESMILTTLIDIGFARASRKYNAQIKRIYRGTVRTGKKIRPRAESLEIRKTGRRLFEYNRGDNHSPENSIVMYAHAPTKPVGLEIPKWSKATNFAKSDLIHICLADVLLTWDGLPDEYRKIFEEDITTFEIRLNYLSIDVGVKGRNRLPKINVEAAQPTAVS